MAKDISAILRAMRAQVDKKPVVSSPDPFKVLVSTVLSQRTRDENTARASRRLFARYKTARALAKAPLKEVEILVKPAGFYRVKAARIKEVAREIEGRFKGKVPKDLSQLLSLPGVGRKTANCVLVYGFGKPAMPVDVHVAVISQRLGLTNEKDPEKIERDLERILPKKYWLEFNHLCVRYGQKICLTRKPKCLICKLNKYCRYYEANKDNRAFL